MALSSAASFGQGQFWGELRMSSQWPSLLQLGIKCLPLEGGWSCTRPHPFQKVLGKRQRVATSCLQMRKTEAQNR